MVYIEKKKIAGKEYFYLTKTIKLPNNKNKKIRTYIRSGETKNISLLYSEKKNELIKKEIQIRNEIIYKNNFKNPIPYEIELKNALIQNKISLLNKYQRELLFDTFAEEFIINSNQIEGSTLTLKDFNDLKNQRSINKSKEEIQEANNSIFCWNEIKNKKFNENLCLKIYKTITKNLKIKLSSGMSMNFPKKYKEYQNKIGNQKTTDPQNVSKEMKNLFKWYEENKEITHPIKLAADFYFTFEKIHPFQDGNGRTGRFLMNKILMDKGYLPLIVYFSQRENQNMAFYRAKENKNYFYKFILDSISLSQKDFFDNYLDNLKN